MWFLVSARMSSVPMEISTVSPTTATCTWRRRSLLPARYVVPAKHTLPESRSRVDVNDSSPISAQNAGLGLGEMRQGETSTAVDHTSTRSTESVAPARFSGNTASTSPTPVADGDLRAWMPRS